MDEKSTESGLAFCLDGDSRMYSTSRKIAHVPLSDYIACSSPLVTTDRPSPTNPKEIDRLHNLTGGLLGWQERQYVLLHIDDRFRFRCLLSWLSSHRAISPKHITLTAADFLEAHVRAQQQLLAFKKENLEEVAKARQENGMLLTEQHLEQVKDVNEGLSDIADATEWARSLLEVSRKLSLVVEEVEK